MAITTLLSSETVYAFTAFPKRTIIVTQEHPNVKKLQATSDIPDVGSLMGKIAQETHQVETTAAFNALDKVHVVDAVSDKLIQDVYSAVNPVLESVSSKVQPVLQSEILANVWGRIDALPPAVALISSAVLTFAAVSSIISSGDG